MVKQLLIILLFLPLISSAQNEYTSKNKKAIKYFETAYAYFDRRADKEAIEYANQAIKVDKNFIEPYILLAEIFNSQQLFEKEIDNYKKVMEIDPKYSYRIYYLAAKSEFKLGMYEDAQTHLEEFNSFEKKDNKTAYYAKYLSERVDFAVKAVNHPVPFDPEITPNVSTEFDDYWPSLTADEQKLITTVQVPVDNRFPVSDRNKQEDLYISVKQEDGTWSPVVSMGPPINTLDNEGAQSFRADGLQLFLTVCNRSEDYGSCDLYVSNKVNGRWTRPVNVGIPINSSAWEAHPSVSADGRKLFFSCGNCKGAIGAADIYMSELGADGKWQTPVNLGDSINGTGNEMSPFIHPDGKTLYFSSESHVGMGGMDLFMSRLKDDSTWSSPVNLGYPINTNGDEVGLIVNAKGDFAYFSSNRPGSQKLDIYGFQMPQNLRPHVVTYAKGVVYDALTKERLQADYELIDLESQSLVVKSQSASGTGEFLVTLPMGKMYGLNVSKQGYLFYSENYSLNNEALDKPYIMDVPLQKLAKDATIVLKNVFFKTDSYELDDKSINELNKLVALLKNNPGVKVEIGGHTDNQGSFEHNKTLSQNRAKSVYDYIVKNGINAKRMTYAGYSFSKPIATNDTEEGRALNRRTEFKITDVVE
ncbi:MAG: hypothetical protein CVU05_05495 [Bacteroidetes bacterium HGW-Bacteroidetes-21]|jgi:outer membrane protein OmpA-like peptidoglycan-associated protein/Tol biopolymer transport system component|nr:MAG: hypothetical protein CVU05_05495 [Bacteroidetes bacterium HGW-Bacteroidetes-21]